MQISEVSVRDFSIADATVPAAERGTYLAFTRPDAAGMRHLRVARRRRAHPRAPAARVRLRHRAGPARRPGRARLRPGRAPARLAGAAARGRWRSPTPTASTGVTTRCTTPRPRAASPSTRPAPPRILEFRRMVAALNARRPAAWSWTSSTTTPWPTASHRFSVLDRIVPGYYHRAARRRHRRRLHLLLQHRPRAHDDGPAGRRLDASPGPGDYKVDGFRFDLMGHHPRANILEVRRLDPRPR